ncbi:MAG: hypothetical protein Q4F65_10805 [Propionibacteriaceae bacterium]|nr:hypothetical protein [Propionibacteriaceae bacterium]
MGVHSHSITAAVDPSVVWARWTDVENWPLDDPDISKAQLNGPVAKGAIGFIVPRGGFRTPFKLVEVDRQNLRFSLETKLPLAVSLFEHTLTRPVDDPDLHESDAELDPDAWVLTHTLTISGPLSRLWDRIVGRSFTRGLPTVLNNIVTAAHV